MFWGIFTIAIVAVSWWGIKEIVVVGTRYSENIERIKRGYPTLTGDTSHAHPRERELAGRERTAGYIDMTNSDDDNYQNRN